MDADVGRLDHSGGQVRDDHRDMSDACHHRVGAVNPALADDVGRMGVDVADDPQVLSGAVGPEAAEGAGLQRHASVECIGIEIVVVDNLDDRRGRSTPPAPAGRHRSRD